MLLVLYVHMIAIVTTGCLWFRFGEEFDLGKHPQGTEVKAVTYSNMQIHEHDSEASPDGLAHVFVVIDI